MTDTSTPKTSTTSIPSTPSAGHGAAAATGEVETFNPWSVVHLVFEHLCEHDLHPTLGEGGDPAEAAAALLRALSIQPSPEGNREVMRAVRSHLAELRAAVFEPGTDGSRPVSE